ncbi:MAG: isochorismatase family cysteine hydrolase [Desulfurococcaceae archaeon]
MNPAVLVIDMLREFVYGRLKSPMAMFIVPVIKNIIKCARDVNVPIIYLADRHFPFDHELRIWGPHALIGDLEGDIIDELKPDKNDIVLYKRSYSGFRDTGLKYVLRDLRVDTLILTGIHTHICVLHTAIDAFYERFNLIIVEDGVAAFSSEDHAWALKYMKEVLNAKVVDHKYVLDLLIALSRKHD